MNIENRLIKEINKAIKEKEVPIAALIVEDGKILCSAHNKREKYNDVTAHAEIICLRKLGKLKKAWRFENCDIYVTVKPCKMCIEAIKCARIRNTFYYLDVEKKSNLKSHIIKLEINNEKTLYFRDKLVDFFKDKR